MSKIDVIPTLASLKLYKFQKTDGTTININQLMIQAVIKSECIKMFICNEWMELSVNTEEFVSALNTTA